MAVQLPIAPEPSRARPASVSTPPPFPDPDTTSTDGQVRFARMAHSSPQGMYIAEFDSGQALYANPQMARIFDRSLTELRDLLDPLAALVRGEDMPILTAARERLRLARDGEVIEYEFRANLPDHSLRWVAVRATVFARDAHGAVTQVLVNAEDITQRRLAEATLAESQVRFERIAETMADAVYLFDVTSNKNIYFSSRVEAVLGYTPAAIAAMGDELSSILLHPDDLQVFRARREAHRALADGAVYESDFRARRPNGEFRWIHARETVFSRDADGWPKQILGTIKDATEAREREETLRDGARRKDEFLAMLAHELRNPLAPILSAAEIISQDDEHQSERQRRARQVIQRQCRHMAKLVDDLLDVSRSVTGKVSLALEWLDVDSLIARALELTRPLTETRGQRIVVTSLDRPLYVNGDATRLTQVLGNLLNNASKYSPENSVIEIKSRYADGRVEVEVADSGAGIAREFLPLVFDLFSQSHRSLDRAEGGLGIGLTLVKSLVELHGGTVVAKSDGPDRGSRFTVILPASRSMPDARHETPLARPRRRAGTRVLVIDDNVDSAEMLAMLLDAEGFSTQCAFDGAGALAELEHGYDVVISDIGLPGMDGFEIARLIRANPACADVVLIALTGYGQPADFAESRAAGFDYHLIKPIEPAALCRLLDSVASTEAAP